MTKVSPLRVNHLTFEGGGAGSERFGKKYPAASQAKTKGSCMASSEENNHVCMVQPKNILTNHRQPIC